jgi:hypothetical protein
MKNRNLCLASVSTVAVLFGLGHVMGCGDAEGTATDGSLAALSACHLDDGTVGHDAQIRACDPQDTKKTTICHIPPGNPANAHTLCVGNPAVPAHISHHGDHVGPCASETPCPLPPHGGGTGGFTGAGGQIGGNDAGSGGAGGSFVIVIY